MMVDPVVGVQSVEDQGAGAIAHHRLRGSAGLPAAAAAQFGELVALLIAAVRAAAGIPATTSFETDLVTPG
ncbi:MAG: hypothetical protein U1F87_10890 [Kiritimatiellia bacterium]